MLPLWSDANLLSDPVEILCTHFELGYCILLRYYQLVVQQVIKGMMDAPFCRILLNCLEIRCHQLSHNV